MKKATNTAKYALTESSLVVVDHMQFQGDFLTRLIGRIRTKASLHNAAATFLDYRQTPFPELMKSQYNRMRTLLEQRNHKELVPYLSQPLYNVYKASLKRSEPIPWNLPKECLSATIVQARTKGMTSLHGAGSNVWYQITCEYLYPSEVKKYHVVERKFQDQTWKFLYFDE